MKALTWALTIALVLASGGALANANDELAEKLYAVKALTGIGVNHNDYSTRVQAVAVALEKAKRTGLLNTHLELAAFHYTLVYKRWNLSAEYADIGTPATHKRVEQDNLEDWEQAADWLSRYEEEKAVVKKIRPKKTAASEGK